MRDPTGLIGIIRRLWWVFALDAGIYTVNALTFSSENTQFNLLAVVLEILTFGMVAIAAFLAARYTGRVVDAIKIGALFWFIWRPIPFLISAAFSIAAGSVDYERVRMAALGYGVALLLFSPIAIALSGGAGWFGKRTHQPSNAAS